MCGGVPPAAPAPTAEAQTPPSGVRGVRGRGPARLWPTGGAVYPGGGGEADKAKGGGHAGAVCRGIRAGPAAPGPGGAAGAVGVPAERSVWRSALIN